jgi:hypothetical protein
LTQINPEDSTIVESDESSTDTEEWPITNASWTSILHRIARTALPIHALMLLALGISSIAEFDAVYSVVCTVQNTVKHSFEPLLGWPKGPPPY